MKKIYLLALAVTTSVAGFAQQKVNSKAVGKQMERDFVRTAPVMDSGDRNVIWSSDFSNCADWEIFNAFDEGFSAFITGINFECGTGVPSGGAPIAAIQSTTAENGYMMVDSDLFGGETGGDWVENCWFQSAAPIPLNGLDQVSLRFQTFYRMWDGGADDGNEYCLVEVSTDGFTWPDVETYEVADAPAGTRFELWPTMETQDPVENPTTRVFNLTQIASEAGVDQIWLRFRWKGTFGYAWMVDDVEVFETPDNDLTVTKAWVGEIVNSFEYASIPLSQAAVTEVQMGAEIANYGGIDQEAVLTVNINGTDYTVTETILAGTVDTLWTDPFLLPQDPGAYEVTFSVPADEVEAGNSRTKTIEVSDLIYGQNFDDILLQRTMNNNAETAFGCRYTFDANDLGGAVEMLVSNASNVGTLCQAFIYEEVDGIQTNQTIAQSLPFSITQEMIDNGENLVYTTIPLVDNAASFEAGKIYFAEVRRFESTDRLYCWSNPTDDDLGMVGFGPYGTGGVTNWFVGFGFTPSVRIVLDESLVSTNEISVGNIEGAKVYPNPADVNATVEFSLLNSENVTVIVRDIAGRQVSTQNFGVRAAGAQRLTLDVNNFGAGVYSVSIQAGSNVATSQLVVR
ncbi:MAG: T9SS type A sorting domain-containing protein [Flavobacteriales bacterium]|jgi:hypothetical protein